jgi:hypothetical protein
MWGLDWKTERDHFKNEKMLLKWLLNALIRENVGGRLC